MLDSDHILLIDDEADLRLTFAAILREGGFKVTTAASGAEALQKLAAQNYALTYLDIRMPEMDGLDVLREIHRNHPELPVIIITAHGTLQSAVEALRLDATDYLLKPVPPHTLLSRTRSVLSEQGVKRRRRMIEAQIDTLRAELTGLRNGHPTPQAPPAPSTPEPASERFLELGALRIDLHGRRATLEGRPLNLASTTFDYLIVLVRHAPETVAYQTLVGEAQGYTTELREAQELARWHIHRLRTALEPDPKQPRYLLTVWGAGYRLVVD